MSAADLPLGLRYDMPIERYHAGSGISKSGLDDIARSPAIYWALHCNPQRPAPPERAGQLEGNLAHCAILEPHRFDARYSVHPVMHRGTKAWKEIVANSARTPIQQDQYEVAARQALNVQALPDVRDALELGRAEVSAYWIDQSTGELCRCRPDWVHPVAADKVVLLDVKTVSDASPGEFARHAARKRYHVQSSFYSDGFSLAASVEVLAFIFVACESAYPFAASACMLDEESIEAGRRAYRKNLDTYAQCRRTNDWPGYSDSIELISLPQWSIQKETA